MTTEVLVRAKAGDKQAFGDLVAPYERELHVHCYRILGSLADADDAKQETLLNAWRGLRQFEGRASVRSWLYRVATNVCLNMRRSEHRRPTASLPPQVVPPSPTRLGEVSWLEPYPDILLDGLADSTLNPAVYDTNETVSLAFTTALQMIPARQRAVLILRDVHDYSASEVADILGTTNQSVHSLLKRGRAGLTARLGEDRPHAQPASSDDERILVDQLTHAFTHGEVDTLIRLMTDDVWIRMPPLPFEYQGHELARTFFTTVGFRDNRRFHMVQTRANRQPALGMYVIEKSSGVAHAIGVLVISVRGGQVSAITRFEASLMNALGLPRTL